VDAPVITATATGGGMWIKDAASTPVTVTVTAGAGPVVIGSRGNLLVGAVNAGSDSATLSSANGAVLDGTGGAANAAHPNVTAGSVTVNSATGGGNAGDALWVDAAAIAATATGGGVWIKDAATTPVTVTVTAGAGPVVINGRGDLLVQSVNAGGDSATLNSATGAVLDGINGGSSASHPNVTANAVTVNAATNAGDPNDSLWVNAATIAATATRGGVWINDAARTPVTLANVTAGAGPVVIGSQGDLVLGKIDAGASDVTLGSVAGSILDGISGHASTANPNVTGALVTLNAAKTVGSIYDRVYVNALTIDSSAATGDQFINTPPTPYPAIPLVTGVSPVTVYSAYAEAQVQPPQQLPITLIGQPLRMAPPIDVTANLFGIALPVGVDSTATQQDTKLDTASKPIEGGNDDEIGRKKSTLKLKKQTLNQSKRKVAKQPRWEG
jgi:hypothetical protein